MKERDPSAADDAQRLTSLRAAVGDSLEWYNPSDDFIDLEREAREREEWQTEIAKILARHPDWKPAWQDDAVCL